MANRITPAKELEKWFADLVCSITGLADDHVLIKYPRDGQIASLISQDFCYVQVMSELDERNIYKSRKKIYDEESGKYKVQQFSQRTLAIQSVFYGPNCTELATLLNDMLFHESIKFQLDQRGLYFVPDRTNGPTRLPEVHNGQWWERCDIEFRFYESVVTETEEETFADVDIRTEVDH